MYKDHNSPSGGTQFAIFLVSLGGGLILAQIAVAATMGFKLSNSLTGGTLKLAQSLYSAIQFGLPALIWARFCFPDRPFHELGLRPASSGKFYLLAILLLLMSMPLESWLGIFNKRLPLPDWMVQLEKEQDKQVAGILQARKPVDLLANVLVVAVIPAFFEEICFRGALQRIMIRIFKNPWAGIVITAILFSAFHMQFQGFLPRMFLGVLLGAAYWYSGSLWTVILAHCFFNGIQVIAVTIYPQMISENPSVPVAMVLVSLVIVVGLLEAMRRQSMQTRASPPKTF